MPRCMSRAVFIELIFQQYQQPESSVSINNARPDSLQTAKEASTFCEPRLLTTVLLLLLIIIVKAGVAFRLGLFETPKQGSFLSFPSFLLVELVSVPSSLLDGC